jgi:hypothetical protein
MGGNSYAAIRRAVERCEGWAPFPSAGIARATKTAELRGLEDLRPRIAYARKHAEAIGRTEPLDICWSLSTGDGRSGVGRLEDEGITWATVGFPASDRSSYVDTLRRFAEHGF